MYGSSHLVDNHPPMGWPVNFHALYHGEYGLSNTNLVDTELVRLQPRTDGKNFTEVKSMETIRSQISAAVIYPRCHRDRCTLRFIIPVRQG